MLKADYAQNLLNLLQTGVPVRLALLFATILLFSSLASAETAYVSDEFEITLRSDKGAGKKILKMLSTGTRLNIIERDNEAGYTLVSTDAGSEGWVLSRYLLDKPTAKSRLVSANARIKKLNSKISELESKVSTLEKSNSSLEKTEMKLGQREAKLQKELETLKKVSSEPIAMYEENQKLKSDLLTLRRDVQSLQQEKINLEDSSAKNWFLVGAAVCVLGIFAGLILPNLSGRRKTSWSSL